MGWEEGSRTNPTLILKDVMLGGHNQKTTASVTTEEASFHACGLQLLWASLHYSHTSFKSLFLFMTKNFSLSHSDYGIYHLESNYYARKRDTDTICFWWLPGKKSSAPAWRVTWLGFIFLLELKIYGSHKSLPNASAETFRVTHFRRAQV